MYCKHCGSQIDDDCAFCPKCGKSLQGGSKTSFRNASDSKIGGSSATKLIYAVIAVLCLVPLPIAEYNRLVLGKFGVQYWLTLSPVLVSFYCLYRLIVGNKVLEEKERIRHAQMRGMNYEDKLLKIKTDAMSWCCILIAIVAFACSGLIKFYFKV